MTVATVSVDCPYLCHGSVDSTPAELRFLWPSSSFFCLCGSSSKQQLALPGFVCSAYCCPLHRVLYLYGSCAVSQNSIKLVLLISIVVSVISWEMEEFKLESFQSQAWIRIINKCNSFAFGVQTNFDLLVSRYSIPSNGDRQQVRRIQPSSWTTSCLRGPCVEWSSRWSNRNQFMESEKPK